VEPGRGAGVFRNWPVRRRPGLKIRLLQWDAGLPGTLGMQAPPLRPRFLIATVAPVRTRPEGFEESIEPASLRDL